MPPFPVPMPVSPGPQNTTFGRPSRRIPVGQAVEKRSGGAARGFTADR